MEEVHIISYTVPAQCISDSKYYINFKDINFARKKIKFALLRFCIPIALSKEHLRDVREIHLMASNIRCAEDDRVCTRILKKIKLTNLIISERAIEFILDPFSAPDDCTLYFNTRRVNLYFMYVDNTNKKHKILLPNNMEIQISIRLTFRL